MTGGCFGELEPEGVLDSFAVAGLGDPLHDELSAHRPMLKDLPHLALELDQITGSGSNSCKSSNTHRCLWNHIAE